MTKQNDAASDYQTDAEYEAGYNAFMLRCMHYAAAHAGADDEAWTKHHNVGIDEAAVSESYLQGWQDAQSRIRREAGFAFGGFVSPREYTAQMRAVGHPYVHIPLKGEPGYEEYEAARKIRVARVQGEKPTIVQ